MARYRPYRRNNGQTDYRQRPQRREPDPETFAREFFDERGSEEMVATAGFTAEAREPYIDLVDSKAWGVVLRTVFVPLIRKVRRELLHRSDLPESGRQRNIGFLYFLAMILTEIYKRADTEMPADLRREFN